MTKKRAPLKARTRESSSSGTALDAVRPANTKEQDLMPFNSQAI